MGNSRPAGPVGTITTESGLSVPFYLIPFDKDGRCIGPETLKDMLAKAAAGQFSDIHIYSHGWNNVFDEALAHYTEFFTGYFEVRKKAEMTQADYRPLIVGVIWPSTALLSEQEETPGFAGATPFMPNTSMTPEDAYAIDELAGVLPEADASRFRALVETGKQLTREEALELARILTPVFQREAADQEGIAQTVTPEKLVKAWEQTASEKADKAGKGKPGVIPDDESDANASEAIQSAGMLASFSPIEIIRKASVFLMKDRAGVVGKHGVGPMLGELLAKTDARVHLTGHSFGAKVVLSALALNRHPRKVRSVLLLQPAINVFCFAQSIPENGGAPGAFRPALENAELPIFSTFSAHDSPLTNFFHLALRRDGDLGEIRPAGGPPSKFAALGGYGPAGMLPGESTTIPMLDLPRRYDVSNAGIRLYAIDGSANCINSHGDVRNRFTEWALANLVSDER